MVIKAAVASKDRGLCLSAGLSPQKTLNWQQVGSIREQLLGKASEKGLEERRRVTTSEPQFPCRHSRQCLGLGRTPWPLLLAWATVTPAHRLPACDHKGPSSRSLH